MALLFGGLAVAAGAQAATVTVEKVQQPRLEPRDEPGSYLKITIDQQVYHMALLGDWRILMDYGGMDVAAMPAKGGASFVGLKVEKCVDKNGKPLKTIPPELVESWLAKLKPKEARYEGADPDLSKPATQVDIAFTRFSEKEAWKCQYQLRLMDRELWVFACEIGPFGDNEALNHYASLTTTFRKVSSTP